MGSDGLITAGIVCCPGRHLPELSKRWQSDVDGEKSADHRDEARTAVALELERRAGQERPARNRRQRVSVNSGALVSEVMPNTAASAAGLQPGDVITGVNGQPVTSGAYLRNAVGQIKPGTNVRLAVLRDGREREFELTLQPASERGPAAEPKKTEETPPLSSGLKIGPIPQSDPHYGKLKGAAVQSVEPGSPAANAGIREGDLIVSVDRKPVETPEDYARLERAHAPDRPMLIEFRRGDLNLFSAIEQ